MLILSMYFVKLSGFFLFLTRQLDYSAITKYRYRHTFKVLSTIMVSDPFLILKYFDLCSKKKAAKLLGS
jgi:hypothetical protein